MGFEIERKYLVAGDFSEDIIDFYRIKQGYICSQPGKTVRIRISGDTGFLTIKGPSDEKGLSRYEFEREISLEDAEALFQLCEPGAIDKIRNHVAFGGHIWEVDVFQGVNDGLVIAELELASETEDFPLPPWIGEEVTGDRKYYNSMLVKHPYMLWGKDE